MPKRERPRRTAGSSDSPASILSRLARQPEQRRASKPQTFQQCAEAYIEGHRASWTNDKHAAQWGSTLKTYAYPAFGSLPVAKIDTGLVLKALEPIWTTKAETASRLRQRIEAILDWAKVRGYREGENPARWKGHLDHSLPARGKVAKVEHHAALAYAEIGAFMIELRKQAGHSARALEFAILTAARSGEVMGATWTEIDLTQRVWTIPAERMKAGKEHRVPLSKSALEILGMLPQGKPVEFVFPGGKAGKPLSSMALLMTLRRMERGDLTAHGFRSTFRDWVAEQTDFPHEVAEIALAHAVNNKVEAAYRRGDLFEKRRQLAEAWGACCSAPTGPARG